MIDDILQNPVAFLLILGLGFVTLHSIYVYKVGKGDDIHKDLKLRWAPFEAVTVTIAIYFWSQFVAAIPLVVLFGDKAIHQETTLVQFATALFIDVAAIGMLYYFLRKRGAKLIEIGLKPPVLRDLLYVMVGYGVYFATFLTLVQLSSGLPGLNVDQKQELGFSPGIAGNELWLVFISLVILPPITEEILMRGFLYTGLRTRLSMVKAGLITSLLFGAAHLQAGSGNSLLWIAALDTFVLSMVLVYLREKTGSLAAPMTLHMLKNGIAFAALFIFKIV